MKITLNNREYDLDGPVTLAEFVEGRGLPKNPAFGGFRPEDPPGGLGARGAVVFPDAVENGHVDRVVAPGCAGSLFAREGSESTHFVSPSKKKGTQRRTAPTFGAGDLR